MTTRLYYADSYLTDFSATVLAQREWDDKPAVVLDQTIFYPTSGGQPHDTGMLGTARVVDVEEEPTGAVLHILDSPLPLGPVAGRIDWERRLDHMQQHTGQHILSQAFIKTAQAATLSFHLGKESSTIDLDLDRPSPSMMEKAEELAVRIVFEDRPVTVLTTDREGLVTLGVRKDSHRDGAIRVIEVEGFDRSPCGGTHVRRSGEIGIISILDYERYKGGTQVEFACGWRAWQAMRKNHAVLKQLGKLYSAHPYEVPRLTEKHLQERSALARENSRLKGQLLETDALDLFHNADKKGRVTIIRRSYTDRDLETIKFLAQKVTVQPGTLAILALTQGDVQLAVAKSADIPGNCGAAIKDIAARLGGKGGGKSELAQAGGIPAAALEEWSHALEQYFMAQIDPDRGT